MTSPNQEPVTYTLVSTLREQLAEVNIVSNDKQVEEAAYNHAGGIMEWLANNGWVINPAPQPLFQDHFVFQWIKR